MFSTTNGGQCDTCGGFVGRNGHCKRCAKSARTRKALVAKSIMCDDISQPEVLDTRCQPSQSVHENDLRSLHRSKRARISSSGLHTEVDCSLYPPVDNAFVECCSGTVSLATRSCCNDGSVANTVLTHPETMSFDSLRTCSDDSSDESMHGLPVIQLDYDNNNAFRLPDVEYLDDADLLSLNGSHSDGALSFDSDAPSDSDDSDGDAGFKTNQPTDQTHECCDPGVSNISHGSHSLEMEGDSHSPRFCNNCNRHSLRNSATVREYTEVTLRKVPISDVTKYERKWITFDRKDAGESVYLCVECSVILCNEARSERNLTKKPLSWVHIWPVYMWKLLTHPEMVKRFGSDVIQFIPDSVRPFWACSLCNELPHIYTADVLSEYDTGIPIVVDVTCSKREFTQALQRNKLGELKAACDKYLMPTILCPWGCTAYLHDNGFVSYDAIINRFFPFIDFAGTVATQHEKDCVESSRSDYLDADIDVHLYNSKWAVFPSVEFVTGVGPSFLTCDSHRDGTKKKYFHLPKSGCCLPSSHPDVLSHVVINAKILHRTKAFRYSTTYQLNKCTGSYSGVECSYVSENRHFDFISHLTDLSEARSYAGRMDIRGLVGRLRSQSLIPEELASSFAERARDLFGDEQSLSALSRGATMITLHDAIKLQGMLSTHPICHVIIDTDSHGKTTQPCVHREVTFRRQWPSSLINIHPNDAFGAKITPIPAMRSRTGLDTRIVWNLCRILLSVPALWENANASLSRTSDWHGFVLSYLSKRVLRQSVRDKQFRGDPFDLKASDQRNKPCGLFLVLKEFCLQNAGPGYVFDDSDFKPSGLSILFKKEISSGAVSCHPITPGDNASAIVTVGSSSLCTTIILYRDHAPGAHIPDIPLEVSVGGDSIFELRMVSTSSKGAKIDSWNASVWSRHGSSTFRGWWNAKRSPSIEPIQSDDLSGVCWSELDYAIYVRKDTISLDKYRSLYLQYLGGQSKVICKKHDVPMIFSHVRKGLNPEKCCGHKSPKCRMLPEYQCPVQNCASCICRECFRSLPLDGSALVCPSDCVNIYPTIPADTLSENDSDESVLENEAENGSKISDDESIRSDTTFDYGLLPTGGNCAGFGTGDFGPDCSDENDDYEGIIPTTHHSCQENIIEGTSDLIGTSVLLNKCGTMLVRRDNQLQATRRERNIIERIASKKDVGTVPLLYLEGILFPSIFWCLSGSSDGGVLGSMPTSFFCQNATRKRFGVASLSDHARTRLKSIGNTASTDPRYLTFLFDSIANGAIEGNDTRVVLSRGFEESMGPAGMRIRNKDDNLYSDTIDNRQCVHDLCGSQREDEFDLFVTLTCNQREHFGIRNIKRYIDDGDALSNYKRLFRKRFPSERPLSRDAEIEVQKALQEASMNLTVRNWMEVRKILIKYILESEELPLGSRVRKLFVRDEYQGDAGNLSHLHMIACLEKKYSTEEGRRAIQNVVRGFIDEIVAADEVQSFIDEGLLEDWDDYALMKDQARSYLAHRCSERCMRRTGPGENDVKCRVPDARYISPDITEFCEVSIDTLHSNASVKVMERIGLCLPTIETDGSFVPCREYLRSKRIYAPVRHGEGNISPVVGRLFAATRSTMNIQICTSNGTSRYVVKYLLKVDENNYVSLGASQKESSETIKGEKVFMCNTKVTSSGINEQKKLDASRHKAKNRGRAIACTEMMQLILGFPQVHSNMEFIRIPTVPLGERPGLERESPNEAFARKFHDVNKDAFSYMVPLVALRDRMFSSKINEFRRHTQSQITLLHDQMMSKVSLDRVFIFGVRPPELLFVDRLEWYYRIFKRVRLDLDDDASPLDKVLSVHLPVSSFVDGLGYEIFIRPEALPLLKQILQTNPNRFMPQDGYLKVKRLLTKIIGYYERCGITSNCRDNDVSGLSKNSLTEWNNLQSRFIDTDSAGKALPIIVFSNVKPCNAPKFIIHMLLSMGHFVTERDMWMHASVKDAFAAASVIESNDPITQQDVDRLLVRWIDDQLRYYPIGAKKMDEYIVSADNILTTSLVEGAIPINELPPVMYTSLVSATNEKINKHIRECKSLLAEATLKALSSAYENPAVLFPTRDELLAATKSSPLSWNALLPKTARQSQASYTEQNYIQGKTMSHIDTYCEPGIRAAKNLLIAGPPGVGKTHCLSHGIIYSMTKGLTAMTTAMLADRAFMLGGMHLHKLFKLRVRDGGSPHRLAELAVIALQKKPELFHFLRILDVLFVDECGQVSAELLSVLDIILRKTRDSSLFMGGVLVIGTIDQVQLRPINGLPFLLSPYVLTTFSLVVLKEYVRCAKCKVLQEMNELARSFPKTREEFRKMRNRLRYLMSKHCTFVETWDHPVITDSVLRIFPRREETTKAIKTFLDAKRDRSLSSGKQFLSVEAEDTMVPMESHSDWKPASKPVTNYLNTKLNEPQVLRFYEGAIYQFTHNSPGKFNATQIGFLITVPSKQQLDSFEEIEILVAPPGTKSIDTSNPPDSTTPGWKLTTVGVAPFSSLNLWSHGVKARRKQYGLRHHIASTIHSAIGHSVSKVATELGPGKDLWEKAMVVVLISRVSEAQDLIFVGDKQGNIDAIVRGLTIRNQYDDYMNHIVQVMSASMSASSLIPRSVDISINPFRQRDIPIPDDTSGVVYLLVSIYEPSSLYIGMTQDMNKRLKQHNSGIGAKASSDPSKRPWGLMSYVSGFRSNRSMMRTFEIRWQNIVAHVRPPDAFAATDLARRLIARHYPEDDLLLVTMK